MGRAHDRGKRPADDAPIEGNMSAIQRAVTGLYTKRGTHQSCQRDSKGEQRKLGKHKPSRSNTLCCESSSEERSAGNPHATFCGSRRWVTAVGDPVWAGAIPPGYPALG